MYNSNSRCPHSSHGFKIYGTSVYTDATCARCVLQAYETRKSSATNQFRNFNIAEKLISSSKKSSSPNPFTDTVSHYPSPGGEAEQGIFKPHTPLVNTEEEIRPSEVVNLCEKLRKTTVEDQKLCENNDLLDEDILVDDEKVPDNSNSIVEQKMKDYQHGKYLLENREHLKKLATQQFYKTSTQRFYEGSDWSKVLSKGKQNLILPLPRNDKSELEGQLKRYNKSREGYQKLTELTDWDRIQTRDGYYVKRPIAYMSESKKVMQIPDYKGVTGGHGEKDVENESFTPLTIMRTEQPKYATPGWKPYIPGYTGHVAHNLRSSGLFSNEPLPRLETTARTHSRYNTYPQNLSKHSHKSLISNAVTLTHPFNPHNKLSKTAERVY